jgi:hypothetical protein
MIWEGLVEVIADHGLHLSIDVSVRTRAAGPLRSLEFLHQECASLP